MTEQIRRGLDIQHPADNQSTSRTARTSVRVLGPSGRRVGAVVLAGLVLVSCGSAAGQKSAASGQVVLKASEWKFEASATQLVVGGPVTLTLRNQGKLEHDLKIAGLTADGKEIQQLDVQPGQSASVTFAPDKVGTYQFFCTLPGHQEAGMKGQFVVVAP